tara:strand:+ start:689 stop:976 length:288 start_codon:yes stop_codon:yes gene_type:complete
MDMKLYTGTFVKKNGDERTMNFVRLNELPEAFLNSKLTGTGTKRDLGEGRELVWDVDTNAFRVFNWNTTVNEPTSVEKENSDFLNFSFNNSNNVG